MSCGELSWRVEAGAGVVIGMCGGGGEVGGGGGGGGAAAADAGHTRTQSTVCYSCSDLASDTVVFGLSVSALYMPACYC